MYLNKKTVAILALLASGALSFSNAFGDGFVSTAYVTAVTAQSYGTGQFFVSVSLPITGGPACATQTMRFVIDPTTDVGKAQIEVIMAAKRNGSAISILGSGFCKLWGDTETVLWVES
jgi:hypothetical protein